MHALVCVGGNVSGVYGCADAAGLPAGADCGAESRVAAGGDGRDTERDGGEGRGVRGRGGVGMVGGGGGWRVCWGEWVAGWGRRVWGRFFGGGGWGGGGGGKKRRHYRGAQSFRAEGAQGVDLGGAAGRQPRRM